MPRAADARERRRVAAGNPPATACARRASPSTSVPRTLTGRGAKNCGRRRVEVRAVERDLRDEPERQRRRQRFAIAVASTPQPARARRRAVRRSRRAADRSGGASVSRVAIQRAEVLVERARRGAKPRDRRPGAGTAIVSSRKYQQRLAERAVRGRPVVDHEVGRRDTRPRSAAERDRGQDVSFRRRRARSTVGAMRRPGPTDTGPSSARVSDVAPCQVDYGARPVLARQPLPHLP